MSDKNTPPADETAPIAGQRTPPRSSPGPGFAGEVAEHAFERFVRGDAARHREGGAGLGLALVRAITNAHGGTVTLASRPGDTTLTVTLPAR